MNDLVSEFLVAATVPLNASHSSGALDRAAAMIAETPAIAQASVFTLVVVGDDARLAALLPADPSARRELATAHGGPHEWDPLTYLCFSRFLQHDTTRADAFARTAQLLLAAGASATTGFRSTDPNYPPEFECVLYGAAGVAHNAGVTRVLLDHGADANDEEVIYHAPETSDNEALQLLLDHGTLSEDSLATMLLRKCDWHDEDGVARLLAYGADPNRLTRWGRTALFQSTLRDNRLPILTRLLDAGGDPALGATSHSCMVQAARDGRRDALELFVQRGATLPTAGADALLAHCARGDLAGAQLLSASNDGALSMLSVHAGDLLLAFARVGNADGLRTLIALGLPVNARSANGDGYWSLAPGSTALHAAAWRAHIPAVRALLEAGADVHTRDARGRTPLALARKAAVDSYWTDRVATELESLLLSAGARE